LRVYAPSENRPFLNHGRKAKCTISLQTAAICETKIIYFAWILSGALVRTSPISSYTYRAATPVPTGPTAGEKINVARLSRIPILRGFPITEINMV
jgi:hypothetical protein